MNDAYGRIQLLLSQHRYDMAESSLRSLLAEEPRDATAHSLLALCMLQDDTRLQEATGEAQQAVGIAPDESFSHYALASAWMRRNRYEQAESSILESLRLDPYDADSFALLGQSQLSRNQFANTLRSAEQGLAVDPESIDCGNLRSIALERLGRSQEAIEAASQTLRRDPDDPMSHAAHGLTLLNSGRYQEAQQAFREALRLDPNNEMARYGMVQALNNRSFVFRIVHKFYVMMSRLNAKAAFGLIFGAWLLMQVLGRVADRIPMLGPLILPILVLYVVFVVLTWIANPLFNTFLRFHPFGQHLLDRKQRWASNLIAPCIGLSIFGVVAGVMLEDIFLGILAAAYWIAMAIPISAAFSMPTTKRMVLIGVIAVVIGLLPVMGLLRAVNETSLSPFVHSMRMFAYSLLGIQIASGLIAAKRVER